MNETIDQNALDSIAFIGETLGPLFYFEPFSNDNRSIYAALEAIDVNGGANEWPLVDAERAKPALDRMKSGIANSRPEDLIWEYRRLFVGPCTKAAPPWGSVYTDKDQVIFGRSTLDLREWMRGVGVSKLIGEGEPEDHIGLMLIMMSWIAGNKPEALKDYLGNHLLTWAPHFLEYMQQATDVDFFTGLASLAHASLEGIGNAFEIHAKPIKFYR